MTDPSPWLVLAALGLVFVVVAWQAARALALAWVLEDEYGE